MKRLLALCLLMTAAAQAAPRVDAVALAALLLRDGHPQRALLALADQDPEAKGVDTPRYYTLKGLAELRLERYAQARADLERALRETRARERSPDPALYLYLAQAAYRLEDHAAVVDYLRQAPETARARPVVVLMEAQSLWALGRREAAWERLRAGEAAHPDDVRFPRQRLAWLLDLGLYRQAGELGMAYLGRLAQGPKDYLAVAESLRRAGALDEAAALLERARLRYPDSVDLTRLLGRVYLQRGRVHAAADLYRRAALRDPALRVEAAELYRRAKDPYQALFLNMGVPDQRAKLRQRLGLLLELGRFEQAVAMAPALRRHHLLDEDPVRYALAYALYKTRRLDAAQATLAGIRDRQWFRKATALRSALARCREERLACL